MKRWCSTLKIAKTKTSNTVKSWWDVKKPRETWFHLSPWGRKGMHVLHKTHHGMHIIWYIYCIHIMYIYIYTNKQISCVYIYNYMYVYIVFLSKRQGNWAETSKFLTWSRQQKRHDTSHYFAPRHGSFAFIDLGMLPRQVPEKCPNVWLW